MRAWIELPRDAPWAHIRLGQAAARTLGWHSEELRGTGPVLLRLSAGRPGPGELLRMPGQA